MYHIGRSVLCVVNWCVHGEIYLDSELLGGKKIFVVYDILEGYEY